MAGSQNVINHIALVLDASGSMDHLAAEVVKVADNQVAYLAQRSKELDQETRVTVYTFDHMVRCLIYDKDVLRLPSIKSQYRANGSTALISATIKALDDLAKTPELYGEHSFLTYVLTDGAENASYTHGHTPDKLAQRIAQLPDHWTLATFVPDQTGVSEAKRFGFPKDNIAVWTTSSKGMAEVGETIRRATDTFMQNRAKGIRGSKNLFALDTSKLTAAKVAKQLEELHRGQFRLLDVGPDAPTLVIADFIEAKLKRAYKKGEAFYQLSKPETVQAQKEIALFHRKTHKAYHGDNARKLLKLPNHEVKVSPAAHPDFEIFVQSTSVNRKLVPGTRLLILS